MQQNYELKNKAIFLSVKDGYYAKGNLLQSNFHDLKAEYLPTYNYAYTN